MVFYRALINISLSSLNSSVNIQCHFPVYKRSLYTGVCYTIINKNVNINN